MKITIMSMIITLLVSACATQQSQGAPSCHGPRRPANPYGSVLAPATATLTPKQTPAPAGGCAGGAR